jgi:hypothetical protein
MADPPPLRGESPLKTARKALSHPEAVEKMLAAIEFCLKHDLDPAAIYEYAMDVHVDANF